MFFQLQSHVWLCSPMDCSTPGFPVLHYLPEFARTHFHWGSDTIQPSFPSFYTPFSSCPQSFPKSQTFPMSQLFASGGQRVGASVSASVLPMNIQSWPVKDWLVWSSFCSRALKSFLQHHNSKAAILQGSAFFKIQLSHLYMTIGKIIALIFMELCWEVMSLLFIALFVTAFLPRSNVF